MKFYQFFRTFQCSTADVLLDKPSVDTAIARLSILGDNPGDIEKDFIQNLVNCDSLNKIFLLR